MITIKDYPRLRRKYTEQKQRISGEVSQYDDDDDDDGATTIYMCVIGRASHTKGALSMVVVWW